MKEIVILECVYGYEFELRNNEITYTHVEGITPDYQEVSPLFQAIRSRRNQAIQYLQIRSQPVNIAEHLWGAAQKAQSSAIQAEQLGKGELANLEWKRSLRLLAGAARVCGAVDPHIPWSEWLAGWDVKFGTPGGDSKKV